MYTLSRTAQLGLAAIGGPSEAEPGLKAVLKRLLLSYIHLEQLTLFLEIPSADYNVYKKELMMILRKQFEFGENLHRFHPGFTKPFSP